MEKYIVKATRTGNQVRITLPKKLIERMKWEKVLFFVLKKTSNITVEVIKLLEKEE